MKINKINLKNYRNHKDTTIEFKSGINLLLGKNGAGKSSIFEALGIALFDVETRDNSLKNAVNKEAKSATITVEFTGNDYIDYIVERKIGNQSKHVLKEKNGVVISERKENVIQKIGELAGISGKNIKDIFRNVISAYQNDLISIFNQTPTVRKELFNKIFDTEIYEKIFSSLLDVENKYNEKKVIYNEQIKLLSEQLKNYVGIEEKISVLEKDILNIEKTKATLEEKKGILEEERKKIQKNIDEFKSLENEIKKEKGKLNLMNKNIQKLKEQILESQKAKEILIKSEKGYNEYLKIEHELNELYKSERILRKKEKQLKKIQDNIKTKTSEKDILEIEIKNIIEKIEEYENKLIDLKNENSMITNLLKEKMMAFEEALSKEKNIIHKIKSLEIDFDTYKDLERKITDIDTLISEEEKLKKIIEGNVKELENIQKSLEETNDRIKEKDELETKMKGLILKLDNLKKSKEQLKDGICPILNEKCMNLEKKGGSTSYFDLNISKLQIDIDDLNNKIISLGDLRDKKTKLENEINKKKINIETMKNKLLEIENQKKFKKDILIKRKVIENKYNNIFEKKVELDNNKNEIISLRSTLENEIKNLNLEQKKNMKNIKDMEKNINKLSELKNEKFSKKENIIKKLEELKTEENEFSDLKSEMTNIEKLISEEENWIKSLKSAYEKYIKNKDIAEKLEGLEEELKKLENEALNIRNYILVLKEKLQKFEDIEKLNINLQNKENEINDIYNEITKISSKFSELKNEIKNLNIQLSEKIEKQKQKEDIELNLKYMEKKLDLTKEFREKIKSMGKYVSSEFTKIISVIATENYRKMTGKNETIIWDSENDYLAILEDNIKGKREFSVLSGGEQVSVAISLRTALANFLSKANFYILDEPTINLDEERKNMLAENLKNMLKEIEQAFIVTHDGSFSEMAENIIKL